MEACTAANASMRRCVSTGFTKWCAKPAAADLRICVIGARSQLPREFVAVHPRQPDIQDEDIEPVHRGRLDRGTRIGLNGHFMVCACPG